MDALVALLGRDGLGAGEVAALGAPRVGVFRASVLVGDAVWAGKRVGTLVVLGRRLPVVAPEGARGRVVAVAGRDAALGYGGELLRLGEAEDAGAVGPIAEVAGGGAGGFAVRAPVDGIFYARPTPSSPAYVAVGQEVVQGQTLGLVEVMKTFNPVVLGGAGSPARGRVVEVLAADGQEVAAGAVLVRVQG